MRYSDVSADDVCDALAVDEVADRVDRERSTAYRAVQRLMQAGFPERNR